MSPDVTSRVMRSPNGASAMNICGVPLIPDSGIREGQRFIGMGRPQPLRRGSGRQEEEGGSGHDVYASHVCPHPWQRAILGRYTKQTKKKAGEFQGGSA